MGLDMYLTRETYLGLNYDFNREDYPLVVKKFNEMKQELPFIKAERVDVIVESIAYWRKANAIHRWFVENVQHGVDNCWRYDVERSKLVELLELCRKLVKEEDKEIWAKELPTQEGFFFGSTEYNEDYLSDIEQTIEQLEAVLDNEPDLHNQFFYYQSSW